MPQRSEFDMADATAESIADAMESLGHLPPSRERALVQTKLDEAQMWLRVCRPIRNEQTHG